MMQGRKFPDFGAELRRPFEVNASCYDCTEFFHGCRARPAGQGGRCLDYFPLPPVGLNGATGQVFPPSRMKGRTEPRTAADTMRDRLSQVYASVRADAKKRERAGRGEDGSGGRSRKKNPTEQIREGLDRHSRETSAIRAKAAGTNPKPRRPSPMSISIGGKERACGCGALLQKRQRCCPDCRAERRRRTLSGRQRATSQEIRKESA